MPVVVARVLSYAREVYQEDHPIPLREVMRKNLTSWETLEQVLALIKHEALSSSKKIIQAVTDCQNLSNSMMVSPRCSPGNSTSGHA